jgi:hypothetical protein
MKHLIQQLFEYQKKNLLFNLTGGVVTLIPVLIIIWLSTFIADTVFHFSEAVRWILLISDLLVSVFLIWNFGFKRLSALLKLKPENDFSKVAEEIGHNYPDVADRLKNVYQLIKYKTIGSSEELKSEAINVFSQKYARIQFKNSLKLNTYMPSISVITLLLAGSLFISFGLHRELGLAAKRIFNPSNNYELIPSYSFSVLPGKTRILLGQNLEVTARYKGPKVKQCVLEFKGKNDPYFRQILMDYSEDQFRAEIKNLRYAINYRIRAIADVPYSWRENLVSDDYSVDLIIPPLVNEVEIEINPPAYTRLPRQNLDKNVGDIIAYPGSHIQIRAQSNSDLFHADIVFSDGKKIKARVREKRLNADFVVHEKTNYHIEIFDTDSIKNQEPIEYSITPVDDLYPAVEIIDPGEDIEISVDAGLSIGLEGNDDFGFTELSLNYQILEKMQSIRDTTWKKIPIEISAGSRTFFQQSYLWNVAALSIGFEDMIRYYATVSDNDMISGPKHARS